MLLTELSLSFIITRVFFNLKHLKIAPITITANKLINFFIVFFVIWIITTPFMLTLPSYKISSVSYITISNISIKTEYIVKKSYQKGWFEGFRNNLNPGGRTYQQGYEDGSNFHLNN